MTVTIAPATLRDMTYIAANMRDADRREIRAVFPAGDTEIGMALFQSSPDFAWTGHLDGAPVCAFGISPLFPGLGAGWAYGTPRMPRAMAAITRFCLRTVAPKLLQACFRRIEVRSAADHDLSHRWLECLGFVREGVAVAYGSDGLDFVTYAAVRSKDAPASHLPRENIRRTNLDGTSLPCYDHTDMGRALLPDLLSTDLLNF